MRYLALALMLFASGCATTGVDSYCHVAKPIIVGEGDVAVISDDLAKQIYEHDLKYQELCQ